MGRVGLGSYVGFGEDSAEYSVNGAGSDVTVHYKIAPGQDAVQVEKDMVTMESLTAQDLSLDETAEGQERVTGSVTINPTWTGLQNILRWVTGHNPSISGTSPLYTYSFAPVDYGAATHYWSGSNINMICEVFRNGSDSVLYQGCVFPEITFNFEPNSFVEMVIGLIGRTATKTTKSTPVFGSNMIYTPSAQSTAFLTLGGTNYICRSASVTINSAYDFNFDVEGTQTNKPHPSGKREVRLEVEIETDDDTLVETLLDWKGSILSTNALTIENTVGAATYQLQFSFTRLALEAPVEAHPEGHGIITANVSARALTNASGTPAYTITLKNGDSAFA